MTEQEELKQLADECFTETLKCLRDDKHKQALETALRAKNIYNEIGDRRSEASIANILSLIYEDMGNSALELQYQLDALDIALDENAYDIAAKLYNNLGSKFLFYKAYDKALSYLNNAVEMGIKANENGQTDEKIVNNLKLVVGMNLATAYCHLGDFEQARQHYEIAKEASTRTVSEELLFPYLVFEALYHKRTGDLAHANTLVAPIMEEVEKKPYTTDYLEVLLDVIELLKELNNFSLWERVLTLMTEHLDADSSIYYQVEMLNQWLIYYRTAGLDDKYRETCIKYYELAAQKSLQDMERDTNTIEVNAEIRRAMRQKKKTDSIIYLDPLTGIGNRNRMLSDSKAMIEESCANHSFIAIGLLDIDFFKESNDTYGHIEGDSCLKAVAQIIRDSVGESGNVYRYGGDEFLILMKTGDVDFIKAMGRKIQDNLSAARLKNERSPICPYVTISQGYTCAKAEKDDSIDTMVRLADRVLYSVKRTGRNNYKFMTLPEIVTDM